MPLKTIKIIVKFPPFLSQSNGNLNKKGLIMKTKILSKGADYTLQNHPAVSSKSISLFKPIIAGSLAAMLGASVASAASVPCNTSGTTPSLCFRDTATGLTDLDFTISGNAFAPTHSNTPIENLLFKFYDGTTPTGSWAEDTKTYTITSPRSSTGDKFTLSGNGKGMVMGANGTGTLTIDFAPVGMDNRRTFELKLENVNDNTLAFKGNIFIYAGKGDGQPDEARNAKFDGRFSGKGMEGNIRIAHPIGGGSGNTRTHKSNFVFENGANLRGNFFAEAGINTLTFEDGHIIGNVEYIAPHQHVAGNTTITFRGRNNSTRAISKAP